MRKHCYTLINFEKTLTMKTTILTKQSILVMAFAILFLTACTTQEDDVTDSESTNKLTVNTTEFTISVDENTTTNTTLETITASTESGTITYTLTSVNPNGAIKLGTNGEILIDDDSLFDFETYTTISATISVSNGTETEEVNITININDLDENTQVNLDKNSIISVDSDDFNLTATKIVLQKVRSFKPEPYLEYIYTIKLIDANNHGPLIMWISDLPTTTKTYTQAQTKSDTELQTAEFNIEYIRTPENNYLYGLGENAPIHNLEAVLENNVVTFNIAAIELSGSSVFDVKRQKVNISFSVALEDIENHPGIARTYDLVP